MPRLVLQSHPGCRRGRPGAEVSKLFVFVIGALIRMLRMLIQMFADVRWVGFLPPYRRVGGNQTI
jgi:hypothetical protein